MKRLVLTGVAALSVLGASAAHAGERECPARQLADGHWNETEVHECMARINGTIEPHETGHWLWKNFPPPEFDKPYEGVLVIEIWPHVDVQEICKSNGPPPYACSVHAKDFKDPQIGTRPACIIFMPPDDIFEQYRQDPKDVIRHETGHCNGWPPDHPNARAKFEWVKK